MLSQSLIETLIAIRNREGTILSLLPKDILPNYIRIISDEAHYFAILLKEIAFGNSAAVTDMLENDPTLLFHAASVKGPNGCISKYVTPYELALKSGDPELVSIIADYLLESENGQKEKKRMDDLYQPLIESMDKRQPTDYDFLPLLKIIEQSSDEDIFAELEHRTDYSSPLRNELEKFRQYFTSVMTVMATNPGMSFNYRDLIRACDLYTAEFKEIRDELNDCKLDLFWRQVIGYMQRGLPAVDRQTFAQGLYSIVVEGVPLKRSFNLFINGNCFSTTSSNDPHAGLGFDFAIGGVGNVVKYWEKWSLTNTACLKAYFQQKRKDLLYLFALNTVELKMEL